MHVRVYFGLPVKVFAISLVLSAVLLTACRSTVSTELSPVAGAPADLPVDQLAFEVTGEETDPLSITFSNNEKTVTFIPMIHIGRVEFYSAVTERVKIEKMKGSVLYYEFIDFDVLSEAEKRKVRSIVGILPTPQMYDKVSGDGYIGQPRDDFLGLVNDKDFNIDLTAEALIEAYEAEFGVIEVTGPDATSDLSEFATVVQPPQNVNRIVLEMRNELVVNAIVEGPHKQIVLLYGEAHGPGIFAGLHKHDSAWKRIR